MRQESGHNEALFYSTSDSSDLQTTFRAMQDIACDAIVVGAAYCGTQEEEYLVLLSPQATMIDILLEGTLGKCCQKGMFTAHLGELLTIYTQGKFVAKQIVVVGLGFHKLVSGQSLRCATALAVRHLQTVGARHGALALYWYGERMSITEAIQAQIEGAMLELHASGPYPSSDGNPGAQEKMRLLLVAGEVAAAVSQAAVSRGRILAEATIFARDLVNESARGCLTQELVQRITTMVSQFGLECEVFAQVERAAPSMNESSTVSQGGSRSPQFVILRHRGVPNSSSQELIFVGKMVTFDSTEGMDRRNTDMGHVAAILGALQAIARLKLAINVTALLPLGETISCGITNGIDDCVSQSDGSALGLAHTNDESCLVLVGMFTGKLTVTSEGIAGKVFCNDEILSAEMMAAGRRAGEKLWPMPLEEEDEEQRRKELASLQQESRKTTLTETAREALGLVIGGVHWAHLDIAHKCYVKNKIPHQGKGATGIGVRTLAELAQILSLTRCQPQGNGHKGEVARLLSHIDLEFEATRRGMIDLLEEPKRRTFLWEKIERVEMYQDRLTEYVGTDEASYLVYKHYIQNTGTLRRK